MSGLFGGGSKPSKPKPVAPTAEERELARQGAERFNRYSARYAPLEDAAIAERGRPTQRLQQGRTNADLMSEATMGAARAITQDSIPGGIQSLREIGGALSRAQSSNVSGSIVGDRMRQDERSMSLIETGIGLSGRQVSGLSQLGQSSNQRAIGELRASLAEDQARFESGLARQNATLGLIGTAAGAGLAFNDRRRQQARIDQLTRAPALNDFRDY